jgi:hypothetical protein
MALGSGIEVQPLPFPLLLPQFARTVALRPNANTSTAAPFIIAISTVLRRMQQNYPTELRIILGHRERH